MKSGYKQGIGIIAVIAIAVGLFYYLGVHDYISFASLQAKSESFKLAVALNYWQSVLFYCLSFAGIMMIGIPISGVLTLIGGYLFGLVPGFLFALSSSTLGVVLSFIIVRYAFGSLLQARYRERLEKFRTKFQTHGASYLLTLYLLMVIPYVVIVVLAALAEVPLFMFTWTTAVGSIPLIFVYALAGQQLGTLSSPHEILSPHIIVLLCILIALALVPVIVQRLRHRYDV